MQIKINRLLNKIRQYKWAFLGLFVLTIFTVLWYLLPKAETPNTSLSPMVVTENQDESPKISGGDFYIVEVLPPSGKVQTSSNYTYIMFKFNKPISKENIEIDVDPYITLKKDFSENMTTLYISPKAEPWLNQVRYNITISGIKSSTGESLSNKVIKHEYYNEKPIIWDAGESIN